MSELLGAKEFGKQRANPYASLANAVRIAATTQAAAVQKDYSKTVATDKKVLSVVLNGVTYTFAEIITCGNTKAIEAALTALIEPKEFDIFVRAKYAAGVLQIKYISSVKQLGTITLETVGGMSNTTTTATEKHYLLEGDFAGTTAIFYNGSELLLATSPYEFTGTRATDLATADQLETDLKAVFLSNSVGANAESVMVSLDEEKEQFVIRFAVAPTEPALLTIGGEAFRVVRAWDTFDAIDANYYVFGK